jgi:hypothetical protein
MIELKLLQLKWNYFWIVYYIYISSNEEIVKIELDIMDKRQTILQPMWDLEYNSFRRLLHLSVAFLHFFVFNEYYGSLLNQFFRLLS